MPYVIKDKNTYLSVAYPVGYWVMKLEHATVFEDEAKKEAEDFVNYYRDEGREVKLQPIRMEEMEG
jgi:hypothetical protein